MEILKYGGLEVNIKFDNVAEYDLVMNNLIKLEKSIIKCEKCNFNCRLYRNFLQDVKTCQYKK